MAILVPQPKFYLHNRVLHYSPSPFSLTPASPSSILKSYTTQVFLSYKTSNFIDFLFYNCLCKKSIIIHDFLQYLLQTLCHFIFDAPSENISLYHLPEIPALSILNLPKHVDRVKNEENFH